MSEYQVDSRLKLDLKFKNQNENNLIVVVKISGVERNHVLEGLTV